MNELFVNCTSNSHHEGEDDSGRVHLSRKGFKHDLGEMRYNIATVQFCLKTVVKSIGILEPKTIIDALNEEIKHLDFILE